MPLQTSFQRERFLTYVATEIFHFVRILCHVASSIFDVRTRIEESQRKDTKGVMSCLIIYGQY